MPMSPRCFATTRVLGTLDSFPRCTGTSELIRTFRSLIELDPPAHTAARRLSLLAMKPAAVSAVLPQVEQAARDMVRAFRPAGHAEIVSQFAVPLPALAIARVLGFPAEDANLLHEWVALTFSEQPVGGNPLAGGDDGGRVDDGFNDYLRGEVARRRAMDSPPDDAITRMLQVQAEDPAKFTDDQILVNIRTLLTAGNETETSALSNGVYRLLSVPGAYDLVRADRQLAGPFMEECLRYDSPLTQFARRALKTGEVAGVPVEEGEILSVSFASVNRDQAQ